MRHKILFTAFGLLLAMPVLALVAQRGQVVRTARASAPVDLTGYWVSVVSEDWRHRMATPRKGDYESVPINAEGRRAAEAWDLAKDNAAGLQCKAFGIGGILRQPGRMHITWQDENTLRIDFDAGTQTRLLYFDPAHEPSGPKTWQGHSIAKWERPPGGRGRPGGAPRGGDPVGGDVVPPGGGGRGLRGGPPPDSSLREGGSLTVMTTHFREGYLRKNGVPYSENASITEYFHRLPPLPDGEVWMDVITVVDDPAYLTQPFYTSTNFKLEPDGSKWNPTPCRTPAPPKSGQESGQR